MRNITGQAVVGDDLYGRDYELDRLWEKLQQGEHILMLAPQAGRQDQLDAGTPPRTP